jgi:hypothetical protein
MMRIPFVVPVIFENCCGYFFRPNFVFDYGYSEYKTAFIFGVIVKNRPTDNLTSVALALKFFFVFGFVSGQVTYTKNKPKY